MSWETDAAPEIDPVEERPSRAPRRDRDRWLLALTVLLLGGLLWVGFELRRASWATPQTVSHYGWNRGFWGTVGRSFLDREPVEALTWGFGGMDAGAPPETGVHPFTHHPPLTGWISALGLGLFGDDERGLGLPFLALSLLCILGAFELGRLLHGRVAGLVTAAAWALVPAGGLYGAMPCEFGVVLQVGALGLWIALLRQKRGAGRWSDFALGAAALWTVLADWPGVLLVGLVAAQALLTRGPKLRPLAAIALGSLAGATFLLVCITRVMTLDDYILRWKGLLQNRVQEAGDQAAPWFDVVSGYWIDLFGWPLLFLAGCFLVALPWRLWLKLRPAADLAVAGFLFFGVFFTLYGKNIAYIHDYWALVALPGLCLAAGAWIADLVRAARQPGWPARTALGLAVAGLAGALIFGVPQALDRYDAEWNREPAWQAVVGREIRERTRPEEVVITHLPNHTFRFHASSPYEGLDPLLGFATDRRLFWGVQSEQDLAAVAGLVASTAPPGTGVRLLTVAEAWSPIARSLFPPPHGGFAAEDLSFGFRLIDITPSAPDAAR